VLWLWRRRTDVTVFLSLAILLTVSASILLAAMGNYEEFYRVRFPMDWGMIAVSVILLLELFFAAQRAIGKRAALSAVAEGGVESRSPAGTSEGVRVSAHSYETRDGAPIITPPPLQDANSIMTRMLDERAKNERAEDERAGKQISIVVPCLNEEEAIGRCIDTIQAVISARRLNAEIIV